MESGGVRQSMENAPPLPTAGAGETDVCSAGVQTEQTSFSPAPAVRRATAAASLAPAGPEEGAGRGDL